MRRINLLPREIAERRRVRRQASVLVALFVVWVIVLAALWFLRQMELRREQDRLENAQARAQALQTQVDALQEFALLEQTVQQKEQTLRTAMAGDVHWSRLLIELSMIIPQDAWLTSFAGSAVPGAPPAGQPAAPSLGSQTFAATTLGEFPGVAAWLDRLSQLESLQNIWVPSATKGTIGTREVVNFSSTTDLSQAAASGRYQQ